MASAQGNSNSSDPTDINHVLESLGSLIGELDACVTEVQDEKVSCNATCSLLRALMSLIKSYYPDHQPQGHNLDKLLNYLCFRKCGKSTYLVKNVQKVSVLAPQKGMEFLCRGRGEGFPKTKKVLF